MSELDPDHTDNTSNSTSEVATEQSAGGTSVSSENDSDSKWRLLFELQNERLMALIKALQQPTSNSRSRVILPEFNPDKNEVDARSWCATADICFTENQLVGGELIIAISSALKGAASSWLSQICYPGMTWPEFKKLFIQRFVPSETCAGTLINLNNSEPNDNESLAAFASRLVTSLTNRWKGATIEEIAVSTALAHVSKYDNRLQRLAFTADITSREQLQKELLAFTFLKRKANDADNYKLGSEAKQSRFAQPYALKCFECGLFGHKQIECRSKKIDLTPQAQSSTTGTPSAHQPGQRASSSIICFRCNATGHTAARCGAKSTGGTGGAGGSRPQGSKPAEHRIEQCQVDPPSGVFEHNE